MSLRDGPILVFVLGPVDEARPLLAELEARDAVAVVGHAERVGDGAQSLREVDVEAVIFVAAGPSLPVDELGELREHTAAPVILLALASAAGVLEEALRADVADALVLPQPAEGLLFSLRKAVGARDAPDAGARGRIVTVFSPKGGTGKSATATNLAAALAGTGARTLVVDLDLQFGDSAVMLGLQPDRTIHDLVAAPGELDPDKLAGYTIRHGTGLDLLAAPATPEEAELVPVGRVGRLLEVAREAYEIVVIDTSPFLHGPVLAALDETDELLVLAILDVPTLKDVRQSLETLRLIEFPEDHLSMVLNRADAHVGITRGEVEAALGLRFRFALPDDRGVQLAVNRGVPVVLAEPNAPFALAVLEMAATLQRSMRPRQALGAAGLGGSAR